MQFLDLNTGYSFDALWDKWSTIWSIIAIDNNFNVNTYSDPNKYDIRYSVLTSQPKAPSISPTSWNTEYTLDTKWAAIRTEQKTGYVFWFPNEQSIRLTYTMPICIYSTTSIPYELEIEENEIFSFITHKTEEIESGGFMFKEPEYLYSIKTDVEPAGDEKHFFHKFYVACKSDNAGEFTVFIDIKGHGKIKIGADFYGENEPVHINLSNFGVEIPDYVQKAIYDSNLHEDYKDNILINRKFKELLSNYWDLMANKGSYKSLLNTLSWFEWGDILRIREIWKRTSAGKTIYDDRELCSLLENKYEDSLGNFVKTAYFALYANTYRDIDQYDSEDNPILEKIALKWGREDLSLKLSLLSQFFSTFFMPIHTSILHAAVEDKIYTNTIKLIEGNTLCRTDNFGDWNYIECNIKDDTEFRICNIRAQVTENTRFATDYKQTDITIGVDSFPSNGELNENSIYNFAAQYYTGPGAIIPIELILPNQTGRDYIQYTAIDFIPDGGYVNRQKFIFNDRFYTRNGKITVSFNMLVKEARDYVVDFMFITASSKTLTRRVILKVKDTDNLHIQMYKVQAKDDSNGFTYDDWNNMQYNDYFFRIQPDNPGADHYYSQYLPYMAPSNPLYESHKGIKLTRTVVIDMLNLNGHGEVYDEIAIAKLRGFMDNDFLEFDKREVILDDNGQPVRDENGKIQYGPVQYTIWVSKYFNAEVPARIINDKYNIIRNSLGFYPQFHNLVPMTGNDINTYTINQYEGVCCGAEIHNTSRQEPIPFRYGHLIEESEWCFENATTLEEFKHTASVRQPFVANSKYAELPDGYYNVKFRYKLVDSEQRELILNSAFRKKSINASI